MATQGTLLGRLRLRSLFDLTSYSGLFCMLVHRLAKIIHPIFIFYMEVFTIKQYGLVLDGKGAKNRDFLGLSVYTPLPPRKLQDPSPALRLHVLAPGGRGCQRRSTSCSPGPRP